MVVRNVKMALRHMQHNYEFQDNHKTIETSDVH